MTREERIKILAEFVKNLEKDLKRFSSEKLTTAEYTAVVEIRESCNRIIEDELCRG